MDTLYPQYPEPKESCHEPDYSPRDLAVFFDEMKAVGLYVLPKAARGKFPVKEFWTKDENTGEFLNKLISRNEALAWQSKASVSGWCVVTGVLSGRLVVIDFDTAEIVRAGLDPVVLYERIQKMCPTAYAVRTPANGVHLFYRIPDGLPLPGNLKMPFRGVDFRGEGGQVVSQGSFNRYTGRNAAKKGVKPGHTASYEKLPFGRYDFIPIMSLELYKFLITPSEKERATVAAGENYGQTERGQKRLEAHEKRTDDEKVKLTRELLRFVLGAWHDAKSYEEWLQMWMSAHHASKGSEEIRDIILTHERVLWSNGVDGKKKFRVDWDGHQYREQDERRVTSSSLFWLARRAGWLTTTGYEIPDKLLTGLIDVARVTDWVGGLDEIPEILLLMSQTGSGKTYAFKALWHALGKPQAVVLVPSIKLGIELYMTLTKMHGLPATLYRDPKTGKIRSREELEKAHILVTTLQTFATKVQGQGVPMSKYGLVYGEESDQLIREFARGGGGPYSSHVSKKEAVAGFACLRDAIEHSGYVWFVDATMSKVSYDLVDRMSIGRTMEVVRNSQITSKALVTFVLEKGRAYQKVVQALLADKQVVVVCDTATTAEQVYVTMDKLGILEGKKAIVITKHTERSTEVVAFMEDVNKAAATYDLVCYNSVMGSGVSIDKVVPDVVVQICEYLPPRANLQLLNRYRTQKEVYCYYRLGENLDRPTAEEVWGEVYAKATLESEVTDTPLACRNRDATLRQHLTSVTVGDENQQERAPRAFYRALLRADGRVVRNEDEEGVPLGLRRVMSEVRKLKQAQKEYIAQTWREVPPIDRNRPALAGYTPLQVAQGEVHAEIEYLLRGTIPKDKETQYIHDTVMTFKPHIFPLTAFAQQVQALKRAEYFLTDRARALTTLANNITLIKVVALVRLLYHDLRDELTPEMLTVRAKVFLATLAIQREAYDLVIMRPSQKYQKVRGRTIKDEDGKSVKVNDTPEKLALAYAKILLAKIGLGQKRKRGQMIEGKRQNLYHIANLDIAIEFLKWRYGAEFEVEFDTCELDEARASRLDVKKLYKSMSESDQERVIDLVTAEGTDFVTAILVVIEGETW